LGLRIITVTFNYEATNSLKIITVTFYFEATGHLPAAANAAALDFVVMKSYFLYYQEA
jgi:hypothetical protein